MSIANYFTLVRLVISPLFLWLYLSHNSIGVDSYWLPYCLLGLWIISELSDAFDGYLARKYNQVTDLGKILDPMADSIARITSFLAFVQPPVNLSISLVFVFLYRDSVVSTLRTVCALRGQALAARLSGKIKAVIQAIAAFLILILMIAQTRNYISNEELTFASFWIVLCAAIYTIFSGIDYIYANREAISKLLVVKKSDKISMRLKKFYKSRLNQQKKIL